MSKCPARRKKMEAHERELLESDGVERIIIVGCLSI
jgi:hypothetical protein